jgi:hypothetical protein
LAGSSRPAVRDWFNYRVQGGIEEEGNRPAGSMLVHHNAMLHTAATTVRPNLKISKERISKAK